MAVEMKKEMRFQVQVFAPQVGEIALKIVEDENLKSILDKVTKTIIESAVKQSNGNRCMAARSLGINRNTLSKYIKMMPIITQNKLHPDRVFMK